MEKKFKKLDKRMIDSNTYLNQRRVTKLREKIMNYDNDHLNNERLNNQLCRVCTYLNDGWAGQAFTTCYCSICGKEMIFPTTDTDELCVNCAKEHELCKHCRGRMD